MAQYIDKFAIMAEIEKRINEIDEFGTYLSPKGTLTNLLCHLDTLEAKEIDLDEEFNKYCENLYLIDLENEPYAELFECAKHFYELGLKTKGE